jgi:hypothetical protein
MAQKRAYTIGRFNGKPELRYRRGGATIETCNPLIVTELDPRDFRHYQVVFHVGNDVISYRRGIKSLETTNSVAKRLAKKYGWKTNLLR